MKNKIIAVSLTIISCVASTNVNAALVNGSTLSIESGSYFDLFGQVPITGVDGIILGTSQSHDFSFTENRIDQFVFLGSPGMHYSTIPTNVLSSVGNLADIDFSGWSWAYNGALANFNLGTGSWGGGVSRRYC